MAEACRIHSSLVRASWKVDETPADVLTRMLWSSSEQRCLCPEEDHSVMIQMSAGLSSTLSWYQRTVYPKPKETRIH